MTGPEQQGGEIEKLKWFDEVWLARWRDVPWEKGEDKVALTVHRMCGG